MAQTMSIQTPVSNGRSMTPAWGGGRSTPTGSPYARTLSMKQLRHARQELNLGLTQVIGTTTSGGSGLDGRGRSFAYTAGAAAVVATVDEANHISQRFYRARPNTLPLNPINSVYGLLTPNSANESRNRTAASLQAAGVGSPATLLPPPDWTDSPLGKSWSAKDRVKAATCVSLSRDGKYLAVGETGYKPRVLIFSMGKEGSSDIPLTCIADHTFGVRCVAFSPDSQYLATLGCSNDGFLFIWSINPKTGSATLFASNKCTSTINQIAWIGRSLITVGTRHVKLWRIDEPEPSPTKSRFNDSIALTLNSHGTLPGRNCLLGPLLDSTFVAVVAITPEKAVVCSDKGDICLLDNCEGDQRFYKVDHAGFSITALAVDSKQRLLISGTQGRFLYLSVNSLIAARACPPSPCPSVASSVETNNPNDGNLLAMASLDDRLVVVDSRHSIRLHSLDFAGLEQPLGQPLEQLPAHGDAVLGAQSMAEEHNGAAFFTWSSSGTVLFWSHDGAFTRSLTIQLDQVDKTEDTLPNELKVVRAACKSKLLVSGDRYGVLRILDLVTEESIYTIKAHAGEITDIAIYDGTQTYIACCSRDRTVQVFHKSTEHWELLQTLDEHVGAVNKLLFTPGGDRLISCSADRTVVIREYISKAMGGAQEAAFLILRTITLKASPSAMILDTLQDDFLIVSTVDRQVHKYGMRTGHLISSFKPGDSEGGDAVVMSSLAQVPTSKGSTVLAGIGSTDKSIRLYDETGTIVGRDWGHTEGVSDIALVTKQGDSSPTGQKSLVTVAVDGTVFIWTINTQQKQNPDFTRAFDLLPSTPTSGNSVLAKPPLRRVLSQSELARFQRSPDEEKDSITPIATPKLRKRTSRLSMMQTPKLEPSPVQAARTGLQQAGDSALRRTLRNRSPSPPSPRSSQLSKGRRPSLDVRTRTRSSPSVSVNEFGSLGASSESLCRSLRAYRKRLATSNHDLSSDSVRELEKELSLTMRALSEKARGKVIDEGRMVKLLDEYSEKIVTLLDEKIRESVRAQTSPRSASVAGSPGRVEDGEQQNGLPDECAKDAHDEPSANKDEHESASPDGGQTV